MIRKMIHVLLGLAMVLSMTACGTKKDNHTHAGKYMISYISSGDTEIGPDLLKLSGVDGYYLELKADGTFVMDTGSVTEGKWEDGTLKSGLSKLDYTMEGNTIVLEPQEGMKMKFTLEGGSTSAGTASSFTKPAAPEKTSEPTPEPTPELMDARTPMQKYWGGDWYGYLWVMQGVGNYAGYNNSLWDALAKVTVDEDNTGNMVLWYKGLSYENPVADVDFTFYGDETNTKGVSESGWMFVNSDTGNGDISESEWVLDPSAAPYEDSVLFEGTYVDGSGSMYYQVFLRPWGVTWEDYVEEETEDALPALYREWYEPLVKDGWAMPANFGDKGEVKMSDVEASYLKPVISTPAVSTPAATAEPTAAPSSAPEASSEEGIVTKDMAMHMYRYAKDHGSDEWKTILTYEKFCEYAGTEGAFSREDGDRKFYTWTASDSNVTVSAGFKKRDNGEYTMDSITISGVKSDEYDLVNPYDILPAPVLNKSMKFGTKNGDVDLKYTEGRWFYKESVFGNRLYRCGTSTSPSSLSGFIEIVIVDDASELENEYYEDIADHEGRMISGMNMDGRYYKYNGYRTVEYSAVLPNGKIGVVRVIDLNDLPNSEVEAVLNSIHF